MSSSYESLRERLTAGVNFLPDKPEENADSTLRALWCAAAGQPVSAEQALLVALPELNSSQYASLQRLIERRIAGVPLAHLTQRQRFAGIEMLAGGEALVPRKETELLARTAVRLAQQANSERGACAVLDVCTGSGNVALAIAHHVPSARVYGADLSEAAVALARKNAVHLRLDTRVTFRSGDLLQPFDSPEFLQQVDVLTCNPPYISSAKVEKMPHEIAAHEPRLAFDGGALGISVLMRLLNDAPRFIRPGGWLTFEVGLGQGPALMKRMKANAAYIEVHSVEDDAGAVRVLMARC